MKTRKVSTAISADQAANTETSGEIAKYATLIAQLITAGMTGEHFMAALLTQNPAHVELAALSTLDEVKGYFTSDPTGKAILEAQPRFNDFAREFHEAARRTYSANGIPGL